MIVVGVNLIKIINNLVSNKIFVYAVNYDKKLNFHNKVCIVFKAFLNTSYEREKLKLKFLFIFNTTFNFHVEIPQNNVVFKCLKIFSSLKALKSKNGKIEFG